MEINGKIHCFFEQSGTFKNEFVKLGFPAEDYDIQNNFGQTDHVIDLFAEIEAAYAGKQSVFDNIVGGGKNDLVMAFFPCIHFCDAKTLFFKAKSICQKNMNIGEIMVENISLSQERQKFFELLMKLVAICCRNGIRLIIENPYNLNNQSFLQQNFPNPSVVDKNRSQRGDYFVKPTAYWFFNCEPTTGESYMVKCKTKSVMELKSSGNAGICSEERSLISPDYARNFICDFIIGKQQKYSQLSLFDL